MHSDEAMAGRTGPPGVPVIPGFRRALYIYKYFTTFLLKYFCSCATITPNRLCSLPEQGKFFLRGKQAPGHDQEEVVFQHLRRHPFRCPGGHTGFFPGRAHRFHIISKKVKKMKGKWKNLLFLPSLLLLFASFFCPAVSPSSAETTPPPQQAAAAPLSPGTFGEPVLSNEREWTIIAYFNGDNNLESFALSDMKELEAGYPGPGVEVIVLLDRSKEFSTAMGDWTGARAYRVKQSVRGDEIDSQLLADCGELNLGDPAVLEGFIRESLRAFPAKKTALFMWDHGSGWINMANDDDAPGAAGGTDEITLAEFRDVLNSAASILPGGKLDLLFFDMCLMGQAETLAACAPFASWMVGAAPTIPGVGMDYTKGLPLFGAGKSTAEIAAELVRTGVRGFRDHGRKDGAYTAFDLSKTDAFLAAFAAFSRKLEERIPAEWANITRTIFYAQNYGGRGDYLRDDSALSSIDLRDWLARLGKTMANPPAPEIAALEKTIAELIIASEKGPMLVFSNGLSIYAPLRENNLRSGYSELDFNGKTGWVSTLTALYRKQKEDGMTPPRVVSIEFGTPKLRQGVTQPKGGKDFDLDPLTEVIPLSANLPRSSYVKLTIEGRAILWGYAGFAYADNPQGDYTIVSDAILLDEKLDPEGSKKRQEEAANISDAMTPVFQDGRSELLYQVGGLIHRVANGKTSVPVTARYRDVSDLFHFTIDGTYSDPGTRGDIPVELVVDTQTYGIVAMTSVVFTENGVAITDVTPKPEGVFKPSIIKFGSDGKVKIVPGEAIRWEEGLDVILEMIPAGKTLRIIGQAESIGGAGTSLVSPPVTVGANPEITPRLDETHRLGTGKLPGKYATFTAVAQRNGQGMIMAPAGNVLTISPAGKNPNVFPAKAEVFGEKPSEFALLWEPRGLPILTAYEKEEPDGEYEPSERRFAVLAMEGTSYFWTTFDSYTMAKTIMMPLDEINFPAGYMDGSWKGDDGSALEMNRGTAVYTTEKGAKIQGKTAVKDNLLTITPPAGAPVYIYFGFNQPSDALVATFTDSGTAVVYKRAAGQPPVPQPPVPQPPVPQPPVPQPPVPQPPVPPVPPVQYINLTGVWGTILNGQQVVMQIQGNQYQSWMNGIPFEAGMFQIQGNMMYGQNQMGMPFNYYFQLGPGGLTFTITDAVTGMMVMYQRMQ